MPTSLPLQTILNAKAENGVGNSIQCDSFDTAVLEVSGEGTANLTLQFQGSTSDDAPDFSSAQSSANHYDYVQVIDLENNGAIDGDTGIAFAGANDFRIVELNTNNLKWITCKISSYVAGNCTVKVRLFNSSR